MSSGSTKPLASPDVDYWHRMKPSQTAAAGAKSTLTPADSRDASASTRALRQAKTSENDPCKALPPNPIAPVLRGSSATNAAPSAAYLQLGFSDSRPSPVEAPPSRILPDVSIEQRGKYIGFFACKV